MGKCRAERKDCQSSRSRSTQIKCSRSVNQNNCRSSNASAQQCDDELLTASVFVAFPRRRHLSFPSLLFTFPEIRHGAPTWKPPTCVWVCHQPFLLSVTRSVPSHLGSCPRPWPSVAMAPARSPRGPSYLHLSACSIPGVDSIQPSLRHRKAAGNTMLLNTPEVTQGLSPPLLSFLLLLSPLLPSPLLSSPLLSSPPLPFPSLSSPILSSPLLSSPLLSFPILSSPLLSFPILNSLLLSSPFLS